MNKKKKKKKMCNAIRVVWAGNDASSNPYHGYVDMLIEIKR